MTPEHKAELTGDIQRGDDSDHDRLAASGVIHLLTDKNVIAVYHKMKAREQIGFRKYGVTTERTDLSTLDWLKHAQEEAMDFAVYLEVLIQRETQRQNS